MRSEEDDQADLDDNKIGLQEMKTKTVTGVRILTESKCWLKSLII